MNLSRFLNKIMMIFLTFGLTFIILRYKVFNIILCTFLTAILTIIINIFLWVIYDKNEEKQKLTLKEKQKKEYYTNKLLYLSQNEIVDFLYQISPSLQKVNNKYLLDNKEDNKSIIYPYFKALPLNFDQVIEIYKECKNANLPIKIFGMSLDNNCKNQLNKSHFLQISFFNSQYIYDNYLKNLPFDNKKEIVKIRKNFNFYFSQIFIKEKAKNYFLLCIFFLFSSLIFKYNFYYLFFSMLLGFCFFYSILNKKYNLPNSIIVENNNK